MYLRRARTPPPPTTAEATVLIRCHQFIGGSAARTTQMWPIGTRARVPARRGDCCAFGCAASGGDFHFQKKKVHFTQI